MFADANTDFLKKLVAHDHPPSDFNSTSSPCPGLLSIFAAPSVLLKRALLRHSLRSPRFSMPRHCVVSATFPQRSGSLESPAFYKSGSPPHLFTPLSKPFVFGGRFTRIFRFFGSDQNASFRNRQNSSRWVCFPLQSQETRFRSEPSPIFFYFCGEQTPT